MTRNQFLRLCDKRSARAQLLSARHPTSSEVLLFYDRLVCFQQQICPQLRDWESLFGFRTALIDLIHQTGSRLLKEVGESLDDGNFRNAVANYWEQRDTRSPTSLFARVLLQAYTAVSEVHTTAKDENHCPRCGHLPQAGVLRPEGHGASLTLICSLCLDEWPCRRGQCLGCGENSDEKKLAYYAAPAFSHIRVQACEACRTYLHTIDLGQDPTAVPDVDELTALPLDVWAQKQGYRKSQANVAGI